MDDAPLQRLHDALAADGQVSLRARWVLPVDRPPIAGGVVTVAAGRIVAVGSSGDLASAVDLGDVALLPGLVNAHTHLEFSQLDRPLGKPRMRFPDWIGEVVAYRQSVLEQSFRQPAEMLRLRQDAIARGLADSRDFGVAAIGEIGTRAFTDECLEQVDWSGVPHCTVFLELLGLAAGRAATLFETARDYLGGPPASFVRGLSPHAPYTVGLELLEAVCRLSAATGAPLAMHVAESPEELELLELHTGLMVGLLESLDAWHPDAIPPQLRPLDFLQRLATASRALVVHGNYLAADEIAFLAQHRERMSVVYCPRTHAWFGHEPYPLVSMLAAGVRVAVGTDSRASNPDLDLLAELRHIARQHPAAPPETILRMGTLDGAEALGMARQFGSLTPGKRAALAVLDLVEHAHDPLAQLLDESAPELTPLGMD